MNESGKSPSVIDDADTIQAVSQKLWSISEMAELFGVTPRTLRFYEQKGLLTPFRLKSRRLYRQRDADRMKIILLAKRIGLAIIDIRKVIDILEDSSGSKHQREQKLYKIYSHQRQILGEQLAQTKEQISHIPQVVESLDRLIDGS